MCLLLASFPSSVAFEAINNALQSDDAERKDAVKKGNAIFAFTLKNPSGETESWYIDLKDKGEVAKGDAPEGKKADGGSQDSSLYTINLASCLATEPTSTYWKEIY